MNQDSTREVVVVGNGPAGVASALSAAAAGARVTLVGDQRLGGRAGWDSLVPSKVWLTAVERAHDCADAGGLPEQPASATLSPTRVLERLTTVATDWAQRAERQLEHADVHLVRGEARMAGPTAVMVTMPGEDSPSERLLEGDSVVLAPGSVPVFPPQMRPDGRYVIAPRFASRLTQVPASIAVIGGGATAAEFAHLFLRLGSEVTWLVDEFGVLPGMHRACVDVLTGSLARSGMDIRQGVAANSVGHDESGAVVAMADGTQAHASMAFLAVGRVADLSRLDLASAGLDLSTHRSPVGTVDDLGRTNVPNLFLVGDASGPPMLANRAELQAMAAGRLAAGASAPVSRPDTVVHAVYTDPPLAQVGLAQSHDEGRVRTARVAFRDRLKPWLVDTHPSSEGTQGHEAEFLELSCEENTGRVLGAAAVGHGAPDALAPVSVAIAASATVSDLAAAAPAYPTVSELATLAARQMLD